MVVLGQLRTSVIPTVLCNILTYTSHIWENKCNIQKNHCLISNTVQTKELTLTQTQVCVLALFGYKDWVKWGHY